MAWGCVFVFGKDALISNDGTDALTAEAVEVVPPASVARVEVEVVGAVRVVWVLRRRPVVAVLTSVAEVAEPAVASSGEENAIAIDIAGELPAVHTIERCPFARAVVKQLLDIVLSGHTPVATPLYMGNVVFRTADI